MNIGNKVDKSMSLAKMNNSCSRKSGDVVSDHFPVGLRVLVVDDDPTCLMILEKMLNTCHYQVTKSNRAEKALSLLRENKNGYDIIISDVHMPDMDGFKLLEHVGLEMDLPVIMMSADDSKSVIMKGVTHGACDYLIKPVSIEALKTIWQHVVRKKKNEWKDIEQSGSIDEGERQQKPNEDVDYSSSANEGNGRNSKRRKEEEDDAEDKDDTSALKKPRVVWSVELHQQFMAAVDQLGVDKAVPKKILELMNVPGLTRENVASHLQKYRLYLRRLSGVSQHQAGFVNSFMGSREGAFASMSSMNGLDLQTLAATGHLPAQSLATLQAATLGRSLPKSSISMPMLEQRNNIFSFENPSKYDNNNINRNNTGNKHINLLHGISTTMEPKQLTNFPGMSMQPNPHGRDNSSMMVQMNNSNNISNNTHPLRLSSLPMVQQPSFSTNGVFTQNEVIGNVRPSVYSPVSQASSVGFLASQKNTDKGLLHTEVTSKESQGFDPSFDVFSDLAQHKTTNNWDLQNVGLSFESTSNVNMQGNNSLNVQPAVLVHQGFLSGQNVLQNRNDNGNIIGNAVPNMGHEGFSSCQNFANGNGNGFGNAITNLGHQGFSSGQSGLQNRYGNGKGIGNSVAGMGHQGFSSGQSGLQNRNGNVNGFGNAVPNMGQQLNPYMGENSLRVKSEAVPDISCQNTHFSGHYGQEDLMSALLKQQDGIGLVPSDFGFDGFPLLDNLPV